MAQWAKGRLFRLYPTGRRLYWRNNSYVVGRQWRRIVALDPETRMRSTQQDPSISVVMPVYNALPYLDEAVQSILGQTRSDFEFVIYDDASTDGSWERLEEWARQDARIKLIRGERNLGPARSSNEVVRHASTPLIARMDADDISLPDRLQRQSEILSQNPDVGIVASLCEVIDPTGRKVREPELWRLARVSWFTPFPHGSMMFRRELFDSLGGYRDECEFWEDLDLVIRASERSRIVVVTHPLYRYRQSTTGTRLMSERDRVENAIDLRYRAIERVRQGDSYDDLLALDRGKGPDRVDPRVFVSLGALALWSNQRPKVAKRLLKRGTLRFDARTIVSLAWVSWATTSPTTLRSFMSLLSQIRNAMVPNKPLFREPVEWLTPDKRTQRKMGEGRRKDTGC